MKKMKISLFVCVAVLLGGCATAPPVKEVPKEQEDALVGKSVKEHVDASDKEIGLSLELLRQIEEKKTVGSYSLVSHNNDLDARVGSSETVPKGYRGAKDSLGRTKKLREMVWNDSLNKLAAKLADSLGYYIVVKPGVVRDANVKFSAKDESIDEIVIRLNKQIEDYAEIVVVDKNKTFNIIYK